MKAGWALMLFGAISINAACKGSATTADGSADASRDDAASCCDTAGDDAALGTATDGSATDQTSAADSAQRDAPTPDRGAADASLSDGGRPRADAALPADGNSSACPADVYGSYKVTYALGCGSVLTAATQQIVNTGSCTGRFVSSKAGTLGAVNGDVSFDRNGDFSGATLVIGSTSHTGCNGKWKASTRTLTATCSTGDASSNQCVISVTRS